FRSQKLDAALLERRDRCQYIRRSEADALQVFFRERVASGVFGFDQLKKETATGALQQQSHRHDAEMHAIRKWGETEDLRIELHPIGGPIGADVLNDTEKVQAFDRRGLCFNRGDGAKVDVIDRELVVAVDKVNEALA